MSYIEPSDR